MISRSYVLGLLAVIALAPAVARAGEQDPDYYKTHTTSFWNGYGSLDLLLDNNLGNTSSLAKKNAESDGGMDLYFFYSKNIVTPDFKAGAFHIGPSADGRVFFDHGGPALFRPALEAEYQGPFIPSLGGIAPYVEVTYGWLDYGLHSRNAWNPTANAQLTKSWHGEMETNNRGYADFWEFDISAGVDFAMENATSKVKTERDTFTGQQMDGYVTIFYRPVPKVQGSPLGLFGGFRVRGMYKLGDLVSTGPATPDVVGAARYATPDKFLETTDKTQLGYDSYRMSARTESITGTVYFRRSARLSWTHDEVVADSRGGGSPAFKTTRDVFTLHFSRSF